MTAEPSALPNSSAMTPGGNAGTALLVMDDNENRRLLAAFLRSYVQVALARETSDLDGPWDVVILDTHGVKAMGAQSLGHRKRLEEPLLLPYLLLVDARERSVLSPEGLRLFDEILSMPVGKAELLERVGRWLRIRRLTQTLEAQRADLEVFASAVAHELRAPLRAISGFLAFASEELSDQVGGHAKSDLDKARAMALAATELANHLLELARLGKDGVHLDVWPARLLIEAALKACEREIQQSGATVEIWGENPLVLSDPMLVQVALTNFLRNALKFQVPGSVPQVRIGITTRGKWCRFSVEDNGVGIAPEQLSRLFLPFARAHGERYPGFGLGLATVAKIAKLLNGRVGASSNPGQGSTFYLDLPIAQEGGGTHENPAG